MKTTKEIMDSIVSRFTYHKPLLGQPERYSEIRQKALDLATLIIAACPQSMEVWEAIKKIDECAMWANASIARHENAVRPKSPNNVDGGQPE